MSILEVRNFSYTYPNGEKPILKEINFSLNRGDFVVITGKSGCGKSTLGKALAGFLFQDEKPNVKGSIIIGQSDIANMPLYETIEKVAYVQQNPEDQFCTLTVVDEIAFGLENLCIEPNEIDRRINRSLNTVNGLDLKERNLSSLSGGEKQKVAIASLLALHPDVLILDEPTSNLDPIATISVFQTLHELRKNRELTVIIIEHKIEQLLPFSPRIYALDDGILNLTETPTKAPSVNLKIKHFSEVPPRLERENHFINLENINVSLGDIPILKSINLQVDSGEFIAIMGPNGSGKSTLLRTIMGFHNPSSGKGSVFSKNINKAKPSSFVENIGFIFQNPDHQIFTQSVWEELTFTSKNLGIFNRDLEADAKRLLSMMHLSHRKDDHPQKLSYGEKRRLNLAALILHKPKLLLIDELLIGQDDVNAHLWMNFLNDYTNFGNSVILVNHHASLTSQYCSRILFMDQGDIVVNSPVPDAFDEIAKLGFEVFLPSYEQVIINA